MEIVELLTFAKKNNASDLHLSSGNPPILRVNGEMVPLKLGTFGPEEIQRMIYAVMTERQRATYEENFELDFAIHYGEHSRFRVNAFNTVAGVAAVFRIIPTEIHTLEDLNLPPILRQITNLHKGLVLVTGPTGSGKSTTLAAMIHHINHTMPKHIITIEDPVEFIHKSEKSLVNQREVGSHTKSFAAALRSALREDPDIILVGEMRDLETISLALTAAETGHLVFGTLHTSSSAKTIDRIVDVFPAGDKPMARTMLSSSLEAVITQLLLRRSDKKGRVAVNEVLIANPGIRNLIRDDKIPQIYSLMQVGSKLGMQVMKDNVYKLLDEGTITSEEAKFALNVTTEETDARGGSSKVKEEF